MTAPAVRPDTTWAFCALVILVAAAWPLLVHRSFGRRAALATAGGLALWLGVVWQLGVERWLLPLDNSLPPAFAKVLVPTALAVLAVGLSPVGRRWAARLPLAALLLLQSFRLPLELLMADLAAQGALPPQMTLHGWNWDIASGILGLALGLWALRRPVPRALVVGYNALGITLLVTVVTIAARSAPGPLAAWPDLPRNTLVFFEPFTALPLVLVMSALMGHVLLGQWLAAQRSGDGAERGGG